jgi:hypothetical protein
MRLQVCINSGISSEINKIPHPFLRQGTDERVDLSLGAHIDPNGRTVEDEQLSDDHATTLPEQHVVDFHHERLSTGEFS